MVKWKKLCNHSGCRNITKETYCEAHKPKQKATPRTDRDRFLDTSAWRNLSKWKLNHTPYCESCAARGEYVPANDVDHIESRRDFPQKSLDPSNLQSLCKSCHSRKTILELRRT